ncbi:ATP-binding protein [Stutzerimonas decontaminans]|nr:ATP-binding protein [Stutzerimonas decontaminans]MCQ4245951.1 ATP-binding protein [Stutzerimonas decontaminans]
MLFRKQMAPEQVFTPRSAEVNPEMYISRKQLESALKRALRGNLHMIIHGQSGTGKSWLYKKTLKDLKVPFMVANLANASRLGSICAELKNLVDREGRSIKVSFEEQKSAEANAVVAKGGLSHTDMYEIGQMEPFEACLAFLCKQSNNKPSILVFDNLEAAFTEPLLKELADLIILCDDERYSRFNVKILVVGVPGGVKEYFYKTPHHNTVANRLVELPEVTRLEKPECNDLVKRGFIEKLHYKVFSETELMEHVAWITDRVPQSVHEYCLELAFTSEESQIVNSDYISIADQDWLSKSQYYSYSVIESHMNERETKAGRRNQTLFALSLCTGEQFKAGDIEEIIRKEFPTSTGGTVLNVPQMLSQLAAGEKPIIKRSPKGDAFTFADPRYKMVLRTMLKKGEAEIVEKVPVSNN